MPLQLTKVGFLVEECTMRCIQCAGNFGNQCDMVLENLIVIFLYEQTHKLWSKEQDCALLTLRP